MIKEKLKRNTLIYKIYLYYQIFLKEKSFIKRKTYSQWGEDLIIEKYFKNKIGKYVDIGCFHPIRHSNTCLLYNKGWSGTNIDLNPTSIELFNIVRKGDNNILATLSDEANKEVSIFFEHNFSSINSLHFKNFSSDKKKYFKKRSLTKKFSDLINFNFDFLNIDCEGEDLNILKTIDFKRFTPNLICIEINSDEKNYEFKIYSFLKEYNYKILCVKNYSHIFEKQNIKN
tara:strand:- start:98 stop:784 length:687 start_codon:yes stop_codon:yes gene_type:complete